MFGPGMTTFKLHVVCMLHAECKTGAFGFNVSLTMNGHLVFLLFGLPLIQNKKPLDS